MNERVCVFIDGGNFYHLALKKLGIEPINFDFEGLIRYLVADRKINHQCN